MVKLKGPAASIAAAGQLGSSLVFANWKGRQYARKLTVPKQPRPLSQVASRALHAFLTTQWTSIPPDRRDDWLGTPQHPDLDNYRRYLAENLRTWITGQPPSQIYPATRVGAYAALSGWTFTNQGRAMIHNIDCTGGDHRWGMIIQRHTSDFDFTPLTHTVLILPTPDITTITWTDGPLPPAVYHYRIRPFSYQGNIQAWDFYKQCVHP